jgi:hypothetical protein
MTTATADWCEVSDDFAICGTRMKEHSRRSEGDKWCFHCRKPHEFFWVVMVPDGISYYEPSADMEGIKPDCTDLFPGWFRAYD